MSSPGRILVVDDDVAVRLRLRDLLERDGFRNVTEAADGLEALAAVEQGAPDLILLDIMMPAITGLDVCRQVRENPNTREVPIIVLSAAEESEAMIAALDAGADDFLRKPFCAPELRAKVRTITRLNRFRSLSRERDRFRWLLDHSLEPLIIADERGAVAYANSRAKELFGLSEAPGEDVATAIGRHFRCDPPGALAAWRELRWPPEKTFTIFQSESEHIAARWYDVEFRAVEGGGETLLKFTNRSGWVRRELETYAFQHLISHKIRTPLNGLAPIISYIHAMQGTAPDPEIGSLLQLARDSADRLQNTLCSVLRYHTAVFAPAPAPELATRVSLTELLEKAAESAGLTGMTRVTSGPGDVGFGEMLEIVFTELFENYAKFSRAGTEGLEVSFEAGSGGDWTIKLCAPGPNLPPDLVSQLGRPYWQPERYFTGEVPGVGLGLATARELLRWRGGELRFVMNEAMGGLEARLQLPSSFFA